VKEIIIRVTDAKASLILGLIVPEVDELTVTRIGPDPEEVDPPVRKAVHRGDKKAVDIVMELYTPDIRQRSIAGIKACLVGLGFAEGTYSSVVSKLVSDGLLTRVNREIVELTEAGLAHVSG